MSFFRTLFTLCICGMLVQFESVTGQEYENSFPYQALVITEKTPIYSGPGSVHYATGELKTDSTVDVYRHDPGGWCAIRPPTGSFSLVPEAVVRKESDSTGKILEDGVQAWVGTRLGTVEKPLWQVKLRKDEQVEILGEVSWPNPEGHSTIWYQIAPPAGEFRWVRISDIKLPKHLTDLPEIAATGGTDRIQTDISDAELQGTDKLAQSGFQQTDPTFDELSLDPPSEKNDTVNRGWKQASRSIRVADRRFDSGPVEPFKTPALDTPVIGDNLPSNSSSRSATQQLPLIQADVNKAIGQTSAVAADRFEQIIPISGPGAILVIAQTENSIPRKTLVLSVVVY